VVKNATETQQEKRTQKNADYKNRTLINADKDKPQMSTDKRKSNFKNICDLSVASFHPCFIRGKQEEINGKSI